MRRCPFPDCVRLVDDSKFACRHHLAWLTTDERASAEMHLELTNLNWQPPTVFKELEFTLLIAAIRRNRRH